MDERLYALDPVAVCDASILRGKTVADCLARARSAHGDALALIDGDVRFTWSALADEVDALAAALERRHGVRAGDVVALHLPNAWEHVAIHFACARLGAVTLPAPPGGTAGSSSSPSRRVRAGAARRDHVGSGRRGAATLIAYAARPRHQVPLDARREARLDRDARPRVPRCAAGSARDSPDGAAPSRADVGHRVGAPEDLRPHARRPALERRRRRRRRARGDRGPPSVRERIHAPVRPLVDARVARLEGRADRGGSRTAPRSSSTPRSPRAPPWPGPCPRQLAMILAALRSTDERPLALREVRTGGAPLPPAVVRALRARVAPEVVVQWGMSELGGGSMTRHGDEPEAALTTIGRPFPGAEFRIVDLAGQSVPRGEVGQLRYRRADMFRGYLGEGAAPGTTCRAEGVTADKPARDGRPRERKASRAPRLSRPLEGHHQPWRLQGRRHTSSSECLADIAHRSAPSRSVALPDARLGERTYLVTARRRRRIAAPRRRARLLLARGVAKPQVAGVPHRARATAADAGDSKVVAKRAVRSELVGRAWAAAIARSRRASSRPRRMRSKR